MTVRECAIVVTPLTSVCHLPLHPPPYFYLFPAVNGLFPGTRPCLAGWHES